MLECQLLQMGSAIYKKEYIAVPGYISDIWLYESKTGRSGVKNTYEYTIHWNYEGKEYTKKEYSLNSVPNDNISEVWIKEDNSDATIYSPGEQKRQTYIFGLISAVAFVVWIIMYLKAENAKYNEEVALDVLIASVLGAFYSLIAVIITAIAYNHEKGRGLEEKYGATVMLLTSIFILMICLILTIMAKAETKRLSS